MSSFGWDTSSSSTSSSTSPHFYGNTVGDRVRKFMVTKRSEADRPLSNLVEKEHMIKDQKDEPPGGMPTEPILFDPEELVLGGKK